ncbi:MAG: hypothetical protein B7X10_04630, partial [Burkholderiales bacterium 21-58-4]
IQPTANGANDFSTTMTDPAQIAAAAPIVTSTVSDPPVMTAAGTGNTGTGTISTADIGTNPVSPFTAPVTLTYNSGANTFTGFPASQPVTVTSNGTTTTFAAGTPVTYTAGASYSVEGVSFTLNGVPANNDTFTLSTGGTGTISAGSVDASYLSSPLTSPVTLTYSSATNSLSGFPAADSVTVTNNGVSTPYSAPVSSVPYTAGATLTFGGMSFAIGGTPVNGDTFTVGPNVSGTGDGRNAVLMAGLQSSKGMMNGTSTFQNVYSLMTSTVASKTSELQVTSTSESNTLTQMQNAQQSVSGVNLDEEATNLLQYQQAYQAAGKLMQVASQLFSTLLARPGVCGQRRLLEEEGARVRQQDHLAALPG